MLGIRHYNHCALDLWVGVTADFYCPSLIWIGTPTKENPTLVDIKPHTSPQTGTYKEHQLIAQLLKVEQDKIRHLAIAWLNKTEVAPTLPGIFHTIKELLTNNDIGQHLRRITFISNNLNNYQTTQDQLFATFP